MSSTPAQVRRRRSRASRPPLRVVRRKSRNLLVRGESRRLAPVVIVSAIVVMAVVVGVLLEQVVLAQSAFKLAQIRESVVAAEEKHQDLLLEAAKLESTDRIERYAREVLGMVEPDPALVNYLIADVHTGDRFRVARGRAGGTPPIGQATGDPVEEMQP
jgi:cell division protein FtsL